MDIIFVRTKLQALIALKLIEDKVISSKFIFVKNFWMSSNEDSKFNQYYYSLISNKAFKTYSFIEQEGFFKNFILIYLLSIKAVFTKSKFYFAGINIYLFSLTKFLNPFLKIVTFDDGYANVLKTSSYYSKEPLPINFKLTRLLLRGIFPKGAAKYMRQKTQKHYSIYPGVSNIIEDSKVEYLKFDWADYITHQDKAKLKNFSSKKNLKVLIGTPFKEEQYNLLPFINNIKTEFDIVIPHPRDNSELNFWPNAHEFESAAEIIIDYILKEFRCDSLKVYHFQSSLVTSLNLDDPRLEAIDLKDKYLSDSLQDQSKIDNVLLFVDTIPHLRTARIIENELLYSQIHYITSNKEIFNLLSKDKAYFIRSKTQLAFNILNKKIPSFEILMAARVDDLNFQILYKFMKPKQLFTFDEGLFTLQKDSHYNADKPISIDNGWKYFISNKIFSFPFPVSLFYKVTSKHFTYFKKSSFKNSLIDANKIIELSHGLQSLSLEKIFIGQPWQYMLLSDKNLDDLVSFINKNEFDVYLIHPREKIEIMIPRLKKDISILTINSSSEDFLNRISSDSELSIYTVASTLTTGLSDNFKITIVTSQFFCRNLIESQENLKFALRSLNKLFNIEEI